jgi:ATP-dependent Clp protease ATP-binding subunit ClpC
MFEHFSKEAIKVIMLAQEEARRLGHNLVGSEQVLLGLIGENTSVAAKVLDDLGINIKNAREEVEKIIGRGSRFVSAEIPFTPKMKRVFDKSFEAARQLGDNFIAPEHLLLGLIEDGEGVAVKVIENLGVDSAQVGSAVLSELEKQPVGASKANREGSTSRGFAGKTTTLEEFGTNLTKLAAEGKLDPVVGRDKEIERAVQILGRRTKNNPVLIGEPGVGKTAIAEGLAQRIVDKNIPDILEDKQVFSLDVGSLVAGTRHRGDFEERIKAIMEEIRAAGNIILVIDEVHNLVGAGSIQGGMDAANILKPALARGELQCLGATTLNEYRQHIERDAALERRFQPIMVGEPSVEETIEILYGLRSVYEQHHKVKISDEAIFAAAKLSDRYISDRFLPDKAIDLIDEAGSRAHLSSTHTSPEVKELKQELEKVAKDKEKAVKDQDFEVAGQLRDREIEVTEKIKVASENKQAVVTTVDEEAIAHIVASWTGIPLNKLTESESTVLLHLEDTLHQRLIGQEEAVTAVSRCRRGGGWFGDSSCGFRLVFASNGRL